MQTAGRDGAELQQQLQRWQSPIATRASASSHHLAGRISESGQSDANGQVPTSSNAQAPRQSVRTPPTNAGGSHRQIIGNYELGRVLATGDFDCRTRLCTHVTTGVAYVVRIYDKHVLAEAQWMWDRVAEAIHVQRKLPRSKHVLEMVECFESNTSVYILMHLFPSMNLTKLFTDEAARVELLSRLHLLSRATLRATPAAKDAHANGPAARAGDGEGSGRSDSIGFGSGRGNNQHNNNNNNSSISFSERQPFRPAKDSRQGNGAGAYDAVDGEESPRASHAGEERRSSASIFPDAVGDTSVATAAAIQALDGNTLPPHIPLALVRVLFEQAVKGIAFLHQHGVAHTGIAPDHLLVSPEGLLRLSNMVSSCFCAPGERLHELRGTMHTVAPEVLRGEAFDPFLSDAWALGVVFYFMLNRGRYPHDGANTLRHILHGRSRPCRAGLPAVALDLLSRLMQVRPEDRLPVDAVLAHPFFTAALPTVEEEIMADTADEQTRNGRRSVYTGYASATHKGSDSRAPFTDSKGTANGSTTSSTVRAAAGSGVGAARRWGRGANGLDDADPDAMTGSWSTPHQPAHPTIFSANSASNSVVMPGGLSATFDNLDGTASLPQLAEAVAAVNSGGFDGADRNDTFIPQRAPSFAEGRRQHAQAPSRSFGTPGSDVLDFRSRVAVSSGGGRGGRGAAATRPVWRPELANSIDALEDLAARVIQYHFRNAFHSRRYKAETRALMKRGQSMYLAGTSSTSSRDGPAADSSLHRPSPRTRRTSSFSIHTSPQRDGSSAGRGKLQQQQQQLLQQRRSSTSRGAVAATSPSSAHAGVRKHKASFHQSRGSAAPPPVSSSTSPVHPRWPSAVGFHHSTVSAVNGSVGGGSASSGGSGGTALTPSRSRAMSGSVVIDTRAGSGTSDNADWDGDAYEDGDDDDDDDDDERSRTRMESYVMMATKEKSGERAESASYTIDGAKKGTGVKPLRTNSLTFPSLAATACGTDWAGEAPPPHRQQGTSNRVLSSVNNTTLLSQHGRRRSTISAVLSSVAPNRGSVDRQRSVGSAVSEGEVCPLCHREPYAIRSIGIRPYAATPYQFTGGTFTTLLE